MKQLIILFAFFFLMIINLYSQSDFRKGYIINNNNDSIYGLIDYKGNIANSNKCVYKKDINSKEQEFTPNDLKSYRFIDSKYYISRPLKLDNEETSLFLEYLIDGIVDILYYRDEVGEHYLVDVGDDKLYELKNEEKIVVLNDVKFMKQSKEYIGTLKYLLRKSVTTSQKIDKIPLNRTSLIKIARDYHKDVCSDEKCIIYEKQQPEIVARFGLLVGLNVISVSEMKTFSDEFYYLNNSQFKKLIYPSIGLFYKINMPGLNEKLYFQYEGTYSHQKLTSTNTFLDPIYRVNYVNDITLIHNFLNNSGILRYEFPKGKIRPTFQIGTFVNYSFITNNTRNLESRGAHYTYEANEAPFSNFDYGLNLGLGVVAELFNKKEISLDLRYQRGFGLIQGFNSDYLMLNIGFQIGK